MATVLKNNNTRQTQYERAERNLLHKEHDLTNKYGILEWMAAVGVALTHDLPEMPPRKAATCAQVGAIALKTFQN